MKRAVVGIKVKFVAVAAAIVGTASMVAGTWFINNDKNLLFDKLVSDGRLLLTTMKSQVLSEMIEGSPESSMGHQTLDAFMEEIVANSECRTVYAYVVDTAGKVISHSSMTEFGKTYDDPLLPLAMAKATLQQKIISPRNRSEAVLHMVMPLGIYGKKWGALCVGLSLKPLQQQEASLKRTIVLFSLTLFITGTATFYVVGLNLTRPIKELSKVMGGITCGEEFTTGPWTRRNDEIGHLQNSFAAMLDRLKQSEAERQRAVNSLIQGEKLATIGRLVAGVAHEINNPLAAMESCIFNLAQHATDDDRNDVDILRQGCNRIETIVRQLSDFSRAGNLCVERVATDRFFREMAEFARLALQPRPLTLKVEDQCTSPALLAIDRGKLHQVALNLLINAADASPPLAVVQVTAFIWGRHYCLTVEDQGVGIPEHLQDRIFEPFFTSKPAGKGTGIGLAICKTIIHMHHGTITVRSKPGETQFTVKIPLEVDHGRYQGAAG
jgi:signal transduction histidine kinase